MKRNDFVTNVLKCNNFHCLASLRLVDLNTLLRTSYGYYRSSLPEASGFKSQPLNIRLQTLKSSLPEASGFKLLSSNLGAYHEFV